MKITCTIDNVDRRYMGTSKGRRHVVSTLMIGKSQSSEICVIHRTNSNPRGTLYKVLGNVEKVFTRFVEEGKATIRFKEPPHDLNINCDVLLLKSFLRTLKLALEGKDLSKIPGSLSTVAPGKELAVKKPKTRLIIKCKSEYPVLEGFPRTLENLQITEIEQKNFDSRILKLHLLHTLDLSHNQLTILPPELGNLPNLSVLNLQHNILGTKATESKSWDWCHQSAISKRLISLDLSHNKLSFVHGAIRRLSSLTSLRLDHNELTVLPSGVGYISSLKILTASHNNLKFLPGSLLRKRLDELDVSSNPFTGECETTSNISLIVLSLKEISARKVVGMRLTLTREIIPWTVLRFIEACDFCLCNKACFNPVHSKVIQFDVSSLASNVAFGPYESRTKPLRLCACSDRCVQRFAKYSR